MQTNSLITLIKKQFPDWSREMIREMLNEIQKVVFTQNATRHMRVLDAATGKDPVITVSAGTTAFPVSTDTGFPVNVWRVCEVYSDSISEPADVICYDASGDSPAKIVFSDPVSGSYHVRAYRFPVELESESVQLEIPEAFHLSHVFEGVCGLIEKMRSGKSERFDVFMFKQVPELIKKMSDGRGTVSSVVTPRGY